MGTPERSVLLAMNFTMFGTFLAGWEIVLILAIVLALFMAKRLPEIEKAFGEGPSRFRKECDDQAHERGEKPGRNIREAGSAGVDRREPGRRAL